MEIFKIVDKIKSKLYLHTHMIIIRLGFISFVCVCICVCTPSEIFIKLCTAMFKAFNSHQGVSFDLFCIFQKLQFGLFGGLF